MTTQIPPRTRYTDEAVTRWCSTVALIASPLLLLAYFALYPAYGETHTANVARAITADPGATRIADVLALAGTFLAVPATLAMLRVLRPGSPRLASVAAALAITGWMALVGALMTDVAAIEFGHDEAAFRSFYTSPFLIGLNATASLHVIGGVLLGIALIRTLVIPRPLAIAATAAPIVHLSANLGGQLWLDALAWLVVAAVGVEIARVLSRG